MTDPHIPLRPLLPNNYKDTEYVDGFRHEVTVLTSSCLSFCSGP